MRHSRAGVHYAESSIHRCYYVRASRRTATNEDIYEFRVARYGSGERGTVEHPTVNVPPLVIV